jgi:hypothetical protein
MIVSLGDEAAVDPGELLLGEADADLEAAGRLTEVVEFEHGATPQIRCRRTDPVAGSDAAASATGG